MEETDWTREQPIFSYTVSSMDMRYIEIGKRDIFLFTEPEIGLVFRGKISGCGPICNADLSELLLEFSLSCEGCWDAEEARCKVKGFGKKLAGSLINNTQEEWNNFSDKEKLIHAFTCVLNSMNAQFTIHDTGKFLEFILVFCPLRETAKNASLERGIGLAHIGFVSLCKNIMQLISGSWSIEKPLENEADFPLTKIILSSN